MTVRNLPPGTTGDVLSGDAAYKRTRAFCFATFRFAHAPRFELIYLTTSLSPRRRRWLRIGVPGKVSAQLLGLTNAPSANQNVANQNLAQQNVSTATSVVITGHASTNQKPRSGLSAVTASGRTAAQRPRYQREM